MKEIATIDAVGHVLCHDMTRIVPGESKGPAFRKGHVVQAEDIPLLLSMGKERLYVWERGENMLHEDEGAAILYELAVGPSGPSNRMHPSEASEGKIEAIADRDGLLTVDREGLRAVNALGEMMIAARRDGSPVRKGDKLAGMRVIPLVIEQEKMDAARAAVTGPLLTLHPFHSKKAAVIVTGSEVASGLIQDSFTPVLETKLAEYGSEVHWRAVLGDNPAAISARIRQFRSEGAELILCTGGMSVDPDDKTPLAIKNSGADIVSYGAPTLPGAMLLVSYLNGVPVLGLPGCVMYAKRTVFDIVLPYLLAELPVTVDFLAGLGNGGLCLNCETCIFPNCAFGAGR